MVILFLFVVGSVFVVTLQSWASFEFFPLFFMHLIFRSLSFIVSLVLLGVYLHLFLVFW